MMLIVFEGWSIEKVYFLFTHMCLYLLCICVSECVCVLVRASQACCDVAKSVLPFSSCLPASFQFKMN